MKELAASGLVYRREDPGVPPRTEYTLTALGRTLEPVMAAMAAWALAQQSGQELPPSLRAVSAVAKVTPKELAADAPPEARSPSS